MPSPNCDSRPGGDPPDLIVVHNISLPPGEYGGPFIDDLFCNKLNVAAHPYFAELHTLQVSAHALIRRSGEVIQYVPFHQRAWHAGVSCYGGRERCNDFTIGIELEGCDSEPYEEFQYQQLAVLIAALRQCYPAITSERLTGHENIAPGRKTDPGPMFDWVKLCALLDQPLPDLASDN